MSQPNGEPTTQPDASKTTGDNANDPNATGKEGAKVDGKAAADGDNKPKEGDETNGLKKALAAERKLREGLEKEKREAEMAKLPELEQAKARLGELEKENAELKTENLRRQIGMELGLPWNLARRIQGDDEDAMRDDAKDLVKSYKNDGTTVVKDDPKNKVPNDAKRTGSAGKPTMNELLRAAAGKG